MTQGDYRIFVGAFPTGELAGRIQAMRQQYDPKTARITPPHVTLAGTYWRPGRATAEQEQPLIEQLHAVQSRIQPFDLLLEGLHRFPQGVLYLGVPATPGLLAARRQLLAVMGQDKHRQFTPHLTLAMRLSPAGLQTMVSELQHTEWASGRWAVPITQLQLMQRGPADPAWRTIATFPLGQVGKT